MAASQVSTEKTFVHPDEALEIILGAVRPLPAEETELDRAAGQVLAEDFSALCDLPPFDNSAMDGYAVRKADLKGAAAESGVTLELRESVRAGQLAATDLSSGEAIKIMTGAPTPPGADAVVMQECTREADSKVDFFIEPKPGEHIRRQGEDVRTGQALLPAGTVLRAYEIALLAAQGAAKIRVIRRPRVAVATSGDELVDYRKAPGPGKIRNSNSPSLSVLFRRWGCSVVDAGIARDEEASLRRVIEEALEISDAFVITGGVSVGEFDLTRRVLDRLGFEALFWKVAVKPGKPLLFGTLKGKPVFGLPGNPLSALICAEEFIRPALEKMSGAEGRPPSYHLRGTVVNDYPKPAGRRQYVFCRVKRKDGEFLLEVIRPQGSAMIGMASRAEAIALAPIGVSRLVPGMELDFRWMK